MTDVKPDQEDGAPKRTDVCRDYERGVCNRGNKCKFFHPADIPPPDKNKLPVCRDFQNGTCDRKSCKYMHITSQEERTYMKTGELPPNLHRPGDAAGGGGGFGNNMGPAGPVCKDFLNNLCDRGNRCKFRHITEDDWEFEKRHGMPAESRKRKRDSFGGGLGGGLGSQFMEDENDMLRRKITDLQRQVADLRAMNDTLYDQNIRYRSQLRSSTTAPPQPAPRERAPVSYPGYDRDEPPVRYPREEPTVRYPRDDPVVRYPRDDPVVRYPDEFRSGGSYPPATGGASKPLPSSGYPPSGYAKDPYATSSYQNNSYDGYTKFD